MENDFVDVDKPLKTCSTSTPTSHAQKLGVAFSLVRSAMS